ncbi:MAG: hypothetical protein AAF433_18435 [Bacteroidota bacterium]
MLVNDHSALDNYRPKRLPYWLRVFRPRTVQISPDKKYRFKNLNGLPKELHFASGLSRYEAKNLLFDIFWRMLPWWVTAGLTHIFPGYDNLFIFFLLVSLILVFIWSNERHRSPENSRIRIVVARTGIQLTGTGEFLWQHIKELSIVSFRRRRYLLLQLSDGTVVEHRLHAEYKLVRGGSHKKWDEVVDALHVYWQEKGNGSSLVDTFEPVGKTKKRLSRRKGQQRKSRSKSSFHSTGKKNPHRSTHLMKNHRGGGRQQR